MIARTLAAVAALLAGAALLGAQANPAVPGPVVPGDLLALESVVDVDVSPDGARVAYVVAKARTSGLPATTLWIYDIAAKTHTQVGDGRGSAAQPRWSPDSRWLAFRGRGDGRPGLMLVRVDDVISDPELLAPMTAVNHPIPHTGASFAWSPGSSRLAYVSGMPGPEGDAGNGDPAVVTRYAYKPATAEGPGRFNDNRRLQLFMVDLVSRQPQQLTDQPFHHHSLHWAQKGDDVYLASNQGADPDRVFNDDIFAFNIVSRRSRRLTDTPSAEYDPAASPDGSLVAVRATTRARTSSETTMEDTHVWVMKPDGSARRKVGRVDNRQGPPRWSSDGRWVYFTVDERGDVRLYRAGTGPADESAPAAVAPQPDQHGRIVAWSIAKSGLIAYAMTLPEGPADVFVQPPGGTPTRVTSLNAAWLAGRTIAPVSRFVFPADGGLQVEAFLTKPVTASPSNTAPLIVMIHGGPHGQQGPQFNLRAQAYAARNWATLMVNYRGSTGYGQAFADAITGDQNGAEARDVLAGVDAAIARHDWIDKTRLGIEGASYGGQLTNWLVTQDHRFKAAVSTAGISNLISFNYTAYYHDYLAVEFGAYPHEGDLMDRLFQRSPIRHVARVKTPVLLLHGEMDNDVPIGESEQFFIALKDVGVSTALVRYPREGHGLRETRHQVDVLERAMEWYGRYLR